MYAYILDTGIYAEHQEFEGRAVSPSNVLSHPTMHALTTKKYKIESDFRAHR